MDSNARRLLLREKKPLPAVIELCTDPANSLSYEAPDAETADIR